MFRTSPRQGPPGPRRGLVLGRRLRRGALAAIAFAVCVFLGSGGALAYWPASGSGSTTARVATLIPPANVSAQAVASTVSVSWTASAGAVMPTGYYVTRITGSTAAFACGSSPATPVATTACTDTSVPVGAHTYVVTAAHQSWSATSPASNSVTVLSLRELAFLSQPPATVTAGARIAGLRVQLQVPSVGGLPAVPLWTPGVEVRLSLGANPAGGTLSGELTATTNLYGVASFSGSVIEKAGADYTITASSTGYSGAVSTRFSVTAGAAAQLVVTSPASVTGVAAASASIGTITLERRDSFGNPATAGPNIVTLTSTTPETDYFATTPAGADAASVTFANGSARASFYYGNTQSGSRPFTVKGIGADLVVPVQITPAAPSKLTLVIAPVLVDKNLPFSTTVAILDAFDNQTQGSAIVSLTSTGTQKCKVNGAPATQTAANGVAGFANLSHNGKQAGCELTAASDGLPAVHLIFDVV
ncbi:hypothetical protein [Pseudarthrobacter sp. DSP2-3-2b1]|uniref:hypothetical protein n=1 Tax=Pseudarthrobacter sp. DSP2-3-2b1 TaxID=2804661 RepID=UPI003CF0635D